METPPNGSRGPNEDTESNSERIIRPIVKFSVLGDPSRSQTLTPEGCKKLVLTRGYICRRPLSGIPFAFDYLAHSAQLFDAHTLDHVEEMRKDPKITHKPDTRFLFERLADREDPETGLRQPYFEIREVDIGQPFLKWYQQSKDEQRKRKATKAWYQWDGRNYEFFCLNGCEYTKQLIGNAASLTLDQLESLAKKHGQEPYDLARNACHDAREHVMEDLGVQIPAPRRITRVTAYLRPPASAINLSSVKSANATASS